MTIKILPEEIASQIAAGEVVERPASVVKELVENSIDANAHRISIKIEATGQKLVEVIDDGQGIPPDEILVAVARHATSKLRNAEDLFRITTLGFRGEALASIGSVSILTLASRQVDSEVGTVVQVDGGQVGKPNPIAMPVGTNISVKDLFYNVPARLKFLKQPATERRVIDSIVTRYALAYPEVRFQLHHDGRLGLQTSGNGDRREVLGFLYGADTARQMLEVSSESSDLSIKGFISPISLTRSNRREIIIFVNGRPIQDAAMTAAIIQAYHNLLMVGRYPLTYLFVEIPADMVDVNVHPTKAEVRFREPDSIFTGVRNAVRRALLAYSPVPEIQTGNLWSTKTWDVQEDAKSPFTDINIQSQMPATPEALQGDQELSDRNSLPIRQTGLLRLIGQVANTYLAAEGPDGLYLIDQHAAHERILFEKLMKNEDQAIPGQVLLQPVSVQLPPAQANLLTDQLSVLNKIGFQVEAFGLNTFLVRSIPEMLSGLDPAAALSVLVEDFEEDEKPLSGKVEARIIARVCKRAAVKGGQALSEQEQHELLSNLETCESPRTCPHGRPTMIHLSVDLLERQFGRRGAR